jgi:hypothetical protein
MFYCIKINPAAEYNNKVNYISQKIVMNIKKRKKINIYLIELIRRNYLIFIVNNKL